MNDVAPEDDGIRIPVPGPAMDEIDGEDADQMVGEEVEPEHDLDVKQFQPDPATDGEDD